MVVSRVLGQNGDPEWTPAGEDLGAAEGVAGVDDAPVGAGEGSIGAAGAQCEDRSQRRAGEREKRGQGPG